MDSVTANSLGSEAPSHAREALRALGGEQTSLGSMAPAIMWCSLLVGSGALAVGAALGWRQNDAFASFSHSYLTNYCFFWSLSIGALFWVAVDHACRAGWGVTVRRLAEIMAANMPVLILLFLPIVVPVLLDYDGLYPWNSRTTATSDALIGSKRAYLNPGFFALRSAAYFSIWWLLGRFYLARSLEQDRSADAALTLRMERRSPVALLLYGVTVTFASFDWLMSLTPRWFSSIFGVYVFAGAVVGFFAAIILAAIAVQSTGRLRKSITVEHYHDLGKLLFGFVIFWGYIAFSQYLLIWYANIPEETEWYLVRQTGPWLWGSLVLLFGHLLIPFFGLLSRHAKRRRWSLAFWVVWLLAMHWIDLCWLVMPNLSHGGTAAQRAALPLGPIDLCLFVGIGGIYLAGLVHAIGQQSLVPLGDPRLNESLAFENT